MLDCPKSPRRACPLIVTCVSVRSRPSSDCDGNHDQLDFAHIHLHSFACPDVDRDPSDHFELDDSPFDARAPVDRFDFAGSYAVTSLRFPVAGDGITSGVGFSVTGHSWGLGSTREATAGGRRAQSLFSGRAEAATQLRYRRLIGFVQAAADG